MPTNKENLYMSVIAEMPCCACGNEPVQIHHIVESYHRLGHMYTIPLCPNCHEGEFSIGNKKKSFVREYGSEHYLLAKTYLKLDMKEELLTLLKERL